MQSAVPNVARTLAASDFRLSNAEVTTSSLYQRVLAHIPWVGAAIFVLVSIALHLATPGYDPRDRFMSELALGPQGRWMLLAFIGISAATGSTASNLYLHGARRLLYFLLSAASLCFLGAGVITLADSIRAHVWLVAGAFFSTGMAMYLLPRAVARFADARAKAVSWGLLGVMCATTGLGGTVLPDGVAQRIAAGALVAWIIFVGFRLSGRQP